MTEILLETTIADWRAADAASTKLQAYEATRCVVKVTRGAYGGLWLEFRDGTGADRCASIEIDEGNITILAFRAADEDPDAKLIIADDAVYTEASRFHPGQMKAVKFNEHETVPFEDPIPARVPAE